VTLLELMATRTAICDGAMGTQLQTAGLQPGESGDGWVIEHPSRVRAVHDAYREAGCDVLITCSFGANVRTMRRYGYEGRIEELNRAAAALARAAAGPDQFVLGDIGPSGALPGSLDPAAMRSVGAQFERQARALLDGGADGVIIETMSDPAEAASAVVAARAAGAGTVVACFTFARRPDGRLLTLTGATPEEGARVTAAAGATVVGTNCGTWMGFEDFAAVARSMRDAAGLPVVVMPNAGQPHVVDGQARYDLEPEAFAAGMRIIVDAGAAMVGGCCGTTPAHVAALRRRLHVDSRGVRSNRSPVVLES
jgi:5-methyltetrahydrofolate--homocysteine methyltransferase